MTMIPVQRNNQTNVMINLLFQWQIFHVWLGREQIMEKGLPLKKSKCGRNFAFWYVT